MVHLNLSCRADSSVATCDSATVTTTSKKKNSLYCLADSSVATRNSATVTKKKKEKSENEEESKVVVVQRFDYSELERATQGFSSRTILGRGSHGTVYRAILRDGNRVVAVKRPSSSLSSFLDNEIAVLSSLRSSPLLVNLLGFSFSDSGREKGRLLVVEYMPNGTLCDVLHSRLDPPGWARRLDLALHTARAIDALHRAEPPVIHRDVKSSNVLIDARGHARLGDFGLAVRDGNDAQLRATPPAGTLGYLDPAYLTPESLTTKTDVFSFGILLLEIISGRHAIDVDHSPPSVIDWAVPLIRKGKFAAICDPRIGLPANSVALRQLAIVAARCVRRCRERRPEMSDVVEVLEEVGRGLTPQRMMKFPTLITPDLLVTFNPCSMVDVAGVGHRREDEEIRNPVTTGRQLLPVRNTMALDRISGVKLGKKVDSGRRTLMTMIASHENSRSELSRPPLQIRKYGGGGSRERRRGDGGGEKLNRSSRINGRYDVWSYEGSYRP